MRGNEGIVELHRALQTLLTFCTFLLPSPFHQRITLQVSCPIYLTQVHFVNFNKLNNPDY